MRVVVLVVVVAACGGGNAPPPQQPMSNQVAAAPAPPAEPDPTCACSTDSCKDNKDTQYLIARLCKFKQRMCACKDKACGDKVNEDYTVWMQQLAKDSSQNISNTTEEDARQLADNATKFQECYTRVVEGSGTTTP